jgi:hypothetical protein
VPPVAWHKACRKGRTQKSAAACVTTNSAVHTTALLLLNCLVASLSLFGTPLFISMLVNVTLLQPYSAMEMH